MADKIELFQLIPSTGDTICLGGTVLAEVQATQAIEDYPAADYHIFFAKRELTPVDVDTLE